MIKRIENYLALGLATVVLVVLLAGPSTGYAQTPTVSLNLPAENFVGEQFCFSAEVTNSGNPGYGPYLRLELPPEITFDTATFLNLGVSVTTVGVFPPAPGNQLTDPVINQPVTGTPGYTLIIIELPIGSVVTGGPPLVVEMCATISTSATVGVPLPITVTPVYEFGDTPTGANGPIVGTSVTDTITPTLYIFEKTNTAPEGERPPGPSWPYDYVLSVDIANGQTITGLNFGDTLPANVQFVGPVTIMGGTGCTVTAQPSTITPGGTLTVTCASATGVTGGPEVTVSFPVHITDILDEATCGRQTVINSADFVASYLGVPQPVSTRQSPVEAEHISLQKGASPGSTIPGTTITYTLNFQVTDYGTDTGLIVVDTLPDGITFAAHQSLIVGGTPYAITPTVVDNVDGTQTITYDIGAVTGNIAAGTAITLSYTATIDQYYLSGQPVHANDSLPNTVTSTYGLTAGAANCTEGSAAGVDIVPPQISKTIVNPPPYEFMPGDVVTFRLQMNVPSGDTRAIYFEDFFPLPVFDVTTINTTFGTDIRFAPTSTISTPPTSITVNATQNSLRIDWQDLSSETPPETIAVDIDIVISDEPFADDLFLTNLFRAGYSNSPGATFTADVGIFLHVRAPDLVIAKGISATDGSGTIDPPPSALPVNGNLTGADAGDQVTYVITVENIGGAPAYDVTVTDTAPAGLTGCAVSSVTNGAGTALTYSGDLFGAGLVLSAPLAANDGNPAGGGAPYGTDTALITVQCTVDITAEPRAVITNAASVTWASLSGSTDFPTRTDDASITIASPTMTKTITGTNQTHTTGNNVVIGEQIGYRVVITVPEGTSSGVTLFDELDAGLAFVSIDNITASAGVSTSVPGGFPAVLSGASITAAGTGDANQGRRVTLNFGTITNSNSSPAVPETITVDYTVVVINRLGTGSGQTRNNAAVWTWSGGSINASAPNVTVREPSMTVSKSASPTTGDAGDTITFSIVVSKGSGVTNPDAFNVVVTDTVPAGMTLVPGSFTTGTCATPPTSQTEAAPNLTATWDTFTSGGSCTLTYQATLDAGVQPNQALTNTARETWTSLPGDVTSPQSPYNPLSCERTGDTSGCGGAANTYSRTSQATVTVFALTMDKSIVSTPVNGSDAHDPTRQDYTIGEQITYQFTVTLPEGVVTATVFDQLPTGGSVLGVVSSRVVAVGANLSGPSLPAVGTPGVASDTDADTVNDRVTWALGTVSNAADGVSNADDQITFEVVAVVLDVAANTDGDVPVNTAQVDYGTNSVSDTADADIVEPALNVTKTATPAAGDAGDLITFRLRVEHTPTSTADAFNVTLTDVVPTHLTYTTTNFALRPVSGSCGTLPTTLDDSDPAGAGLTVVWNTLPQGSSCEVEFQAIIATTAPAGTTLINTGDLDWESLPAGGRSYQDSASATVSVEQNTLNKVIVTPMDGNATIGEQITYEFTVAFAEGLTENTVVTDQLPRAGTDGAAFEVVSSQITFIGANLSAVPALPAVGTPGVASDTDSDSVNDRVTWTLGDVTNTPDGVVNAQDTIVFQVVARVVDAPVNVGLLAGQDTNVLNTASVQHTGGTISGTVGIDLVEPQLTVSKANNAAGLLDAGDTFTVTLTVSHTAQSLADAHQITLTDTLPSPGLSWVGDGTVGGTCGATVNSSGAPVITFAFPSLSLGSSCTITYQVAVSADAEPDTTYSNSVSGSYNSLADGTGRAGTMGPAQSSFSTAAPAIAKTVSATSLPETGSSAHNPANPDLAIGEAVTYTVTVTLPEGQINGVVITDVAPATAAGVIELQSASVTAQGANLSPALVGTAGTLSDALLSDGLNDTATFSLGTITNTPDNVANADDTLTITVVGLLRDLPANADGDTLTNTATLQYASGPDQSASASVDVVEPILTLSKTFLDDPANPGDTVRVQLVITNTGTGPAYGVVVEDVLDPTVWDVSSAANVSAPAGFTFSNSPAGTVRYTGGPVLPGAGNAVTLVFQATLLNTLLPTQSPISNEAEIVAGSSAPTGGRDASGATASDTLTLTFPDLRIVKTEAAAEPFAPGSVIVYNLVVDNIGSGPSGPITITETVPLNTTFNAANSTPTWSCADGSPAGTTCTYTLAALAPTDAPVTVQFAVRVNTPFPAGVSQVENTAQVADDGSRGGDTNPTNNQDTETTSITATPAVAATKTDTLTVDVNGDGQVNPGDTIRYTVVITNSGDRDAANVTFSDTPDPNTTLVVGSVTTTQGTITAGNTAGDTAVAVTIGTIPGGGGSVTITFDVTVNNPLPGGVELLSNQGLVGGDNIPDTLTDDPDTTDPDDPTDTPVIAAPQIVATKVDTLVVDVNGDGQVNPGDTIRYTIVITNTGDQDAASVMFTDTPDANTTLVVGSVTTTQGTVTVGNMFGDTTVEVALGTIPGGGGSATITFDVTLNYPLPAGPLTIANQGVVNGDEVPTDTPTDDPDTSTEDDPTVTPYVAAPDVALTKTDALVVDNNTNGVANPGDVIEYTIVIVNSGDKGAANVIFSDTPDPNTTLVVGSVTTTQGTVVSGNTAGDTSVTVNVGDISGAGGSVTITFRVTVNPSLPADVFQVANQGVASGDDIPNTPSDDPGTTDPDDPTITPVDGTPDISATKSDTLAIDANGDGVANPGDTLEYTIVITNSGDRDASNVVFSDTPGTNTTLVAGSVTTTQGAVVSGNTAGDTSVTVNVGTIPGAGGSVTITFRVTINSPLVPPTTIQVQNQGVVTGGNFPDEPTDDPATAQPGDPTITPLILAPIVEAQKTDALWDDVNGNGAADPGDTLRYTVVITNQGGVNATGVVFTDTPDANTTLVVGSVTTTQGTVTQGNTPGDTSVQVSLGAIPPEGSATITFQVTINDPLVPETTTQVANQGRVTGDDFRDVLTDDPDTPAASDPTITPLAGGTVLRVDKVDALAVDVRGDGVANPGDTLEYTITITNTGAVDAQNVVFSDTPGANTTLVVGSVITSGTVVSGNTPGDTSVVVNFGTVAAGETVTVVFRVTINRPLVPPDTTVVSNQGLVIGDNVSDTPTDDPDTPQPGDPTDTPLGRPTEEPELGVTKTDRLFDDSPSGDGVPSPGDVLQYTVVITNTGQATAEGIVFTDTPDPNTALVVGSVTTTQGVIPQGNTPGDTTVTVDIGDILPGVSVTINFRVTIANPIPEGVTSVANQGLVSGANVPNTPSDDPDTPAVDDPTITPLGLIPWIEAYKTAELTGDVNGDGVANPGDTLTYTIVITNYGYADALNVVFTDILPPHLQLIVGSVTVSDPTALVTQDTNVTVQIAAIAPGASVTITFRARIDPALDSSVTRVANQGVVAGSNFPNEPTDDPDTPTDDDRTIVPVVHEGEEPGGGGPEVLFFDPSLSKIGVLEHGQLGLPGESLTWILTITNVGTGPGTNVQIVDRVPDELRIDGVMFEGGTYTIEGQTVIFTIAQLNPGQTLTAYIYTTVLRSPADGVLLNIADLTGTGPDGSVRTVSASAQVMVVQALPNTGYPPVEGTRPVWPLVALGLGLIAVGAGAFGWRVRRRA